LIDIPASKAGGAPHTLIPTLKLRLAKSLSFEVIAEAAGLLGEATECLSDRCASAEYRASLLATETRRALLALAE
jgi:carbon-monoxide dehydrogenase medium subunit